MQKILDKIPEEKAYIFSISAILLLLPFAVNNSNRAMVLLCIVWVFLTMPKLKWRNIYFTPLIFFLLFFFWHQLGFIYSDLSIIPKLRILEKKISLLAIPTVILTMPNISEKGFKIILKSLVVSTIIALSYCISYSYLEYLESGDFNAFFYDAFASHIDMHPVYLSFYTLITLCAWVFYFFKKNDSLILKVTKLILAVFLFISIILLSARIMLIACFIIFFILILKKITDSFNKKIAYLITLTSTVLIVFFVFKLDFIKKRFQAFNNLDIEHILTADSFEKYYLFPGEKLRILNARIFYEILNEQNAFLQGVGTGDGFELLNDKIKKYRSKTFKEGVEYTKLNFHNQYMETTVDLGLIGLILLLSIYFSTLKSAYNKKDYLLLIFIFVTVLFSSTESFLERQKGIVFFTLFFSLLQKRLFSASQIQ